jgi:hypothetical protein
VPQIPCVQYPKEETLLSSKLPFLVGIPHFLDCPVGAKLLVLRLSHFILQVLLEIFLLSFPSRSFSWEEQQKGPKVRKQTRLSREPKA